MSYYKKDLEKNNADIAIGKLAKALYKDSRFVDSFKEILNTMKEKPTDDEVSSFCHYWIRKDNQGKPPKYQDIKRYIEYTRPKNIKCPFNLCDGSGFLEVYKKGYLPNDYIYAKCCKCVSVDDFDRTMEYYELSPYQKSINLNY